MRSFLKKYVRKFRFAFAGLFHGMRYDMSILLQCLIGLGVIVCCFFFSLEVWEWVAILGVVGAVIALEFVNSAIEGIVDKICPQYDIDAKRIKDYAAAAVLVMSCIAAVIGILILGGKIW